MLSAKALMLASLLGGVRSWGMHVPRPDHNSLTQIASKCLMIVGSPDLYYLQGASVGPDPIGFTKQEVVVEIAKATEVPIIITPTLTDPSIYSTAGPNEEAFAAYWPRDASFEVGFSTYFIEVAEHLGTGLVLTILLVLYCAIIKPIHLVLPHFTDPSPIDEIHVLLDHIARKKYATFFWLAVILYLPVKSFLATIDPREDLDIRLRRAEDLIHSHSILLRALDNDLRMCKTYLSDLGSRMNASEAGLGDIALFIEQQALSVIHKYIDFETSKLTAKFNVEVKGFTWRTQCLESEIKALQATLLQMIRQGGNPANLPSMRRPQRSLQGIPGGYPSGTPSASSGSVIFNSSPASFTFSDAPVDFTAGGTSGGSPFSDSTPSDSAPNSAMAHKGE